MREKIDIIRKELEKISKRDISIMEVCGTHTMSLARHAIRSLIPENINVISGPGCPVCVTSASDIEAAISLAQRPNTIVATFGDMLKVPSRNDSLQNHKNVQVIYSPLEAVEWAKDNSNMEVVLLGIGFETTTPLIAATIESAKEDGVKNFSVISMGKTVPTALQAICSDPENKVEGYILPGHVSAITGRKYFDFLKPYNVTGVISGFDPLDVMECLYLLTKHINDKNPAIINNYPRLVTEEGNKKAMECLYRVFEDCDANWRGIGVIPMSGLKIRSTYEEFDAAKKFDIQPQEVEETPGCLCGEILMGKKKPFACGHFGKGCTPANPIGPCMVSSEGTCAAFYKYGR